MAASKPQPEQSRTTGRSLRHPDLFTGEEAAEYVGIARLDQLPEEYRPRPMPYNSRFYHRRNLDQIIERAAQQASSQAGTRLAS